MHVPQIQVYMNFRSERNKQCKANTNSGELIVYYQQDTSKVCV